MRSLNVIPRSFPGGEVVKKNPSAIARDTRDGSSIRG